jgi:hypothetical protein
VLVERDGRGGEDDFAEFGLVKASFNHHRIPIPTLGPNVLRMIRASDLSHASQSGRGLD